jgi:WD40 repeat protein
VATADGKARLWDVATVRRRRDLDVSGAGGLVFAPDGKTVVSWRTVGAEGRVTRWDAATGKILGWPCGTRVEPVHALAFSPDGKTLASVTDLPYDPRRNRTDSLIRLWDVDLCRARLAFRYEGDWVSCLAFMPDGKALAAGDSNAGIVLWDAGTGKELRRLKLGGCSCLAFAPDGKAIAAGSSQNEVVSLWDVATGERLATLPAPHSFWGSKVHRQSVDAVSFSADGKTLACACTNSTGGDFFTGRGAPFIEVELWDIPTVMWMAPPMFGRLITR